MQHTRIACTVCWNAVARSEAVACAGCELVYFCGRACADRGSGAHRSECEAFRARFRKMSADEKLLWRLNRGVLRHLLWPEFVSITTFFPRPLITADNGVLLISFDGPLDALGRSKEEAVESIQQHLFVALSRLTGHFHRLNRILSAVLAGTTIARPLSRVSFMRVRVVPGEEARALAELDCSLSATTLSNWTGEPRGRVMIAASIDGRTASTSVTLAVLD